MHISANVRRALILLGALLVAVPQAGVADVARSTSSPLALFDLPAPAGTTGSEMSGPVPCTPIPFIDDRCEEWVGPRVDGPGKGPDGPGGPSVEDPVGVSPDGATFFTVGLADVDASANQNLDMMTVATDAATGATRWTARIAGSQPHLMGVGLAVDPTGRNVYVTGRGGSNSYQPCTMTTVAYEAATGRQLWAISEGTGTSDCVYFNALGVDPSGQRLYIAADRKQSSGLSRFVVSAHDTANGSRLWTDDYLGTLEAGASASALAVSPDGSRLYVGGSSLGLFYGTPLPMSWTTVAYDAATGQRQWTHSSPKMTNSRPLAGVAVSSDGSRVYLAGSGRLTNERSFDIVVTSVDAATGTQAWSNYYNGPGPNNQNFDGFGSGDVIVVSPDGGKVVVAGFSNSVNGVGIDFVTVSFNTVTGAQQWASRKDDGYWQYWSPSILMSPDGSRVYVGGLASPADSFNSYLPTIAYDTVSGSQAWMARYADGYEYWGGMALSPNGERLFVAGAHASWASPGVSNSYDFFSVAYRTLGPPS